MVIVGRLKFSVTIALCTLKLRAAGVTHGAAVVFTVIVRPLPNPIPGIE
jgi:hypothetical protein